MSDKGNTQRRRLGKNGPEVLPIGLAGNAAATRVSARRSDRR